MAGPFTEDILRNLEANHTEAYRAVVEYARNCGVSPSSLPRTARMPPSYRATKWRRTSVPPHPLIRTTVSTVASRSAKRKVKAPKALQLPKKANKPKGKISRVDCAASPVPLSPAPATAVEREEAETPRAPRVKPPPPIYVQEKHMWDMVSQWLNSQNINFSTARLTQVGIKVHCHLGGQAQTGETLDYPGKAQLKRPATKVAAQDSDSGLDSGEGRRSLGRRLMWEGRVCHGAMLRRWQKRSTARGGWVPLLTRRPKRRRRALLQCAPRSGNHLSAPEGERGDSFRVDDPLAMGSSSAH